VNLPCYEDPDHSHRTLGSYYRYLTYLPYTMEVEPTARRSGSVSAGADADLAKMGYKSELPRNLSMLSVLGM